MAKIKIVDPDIAEPGLGIYNINDTYYTITSRTTYHSDQHWQECFELFADGGCQDLMAVFNSTSVPIRPLGLNGAAVDVSILADIIKNTIGIIHLLDGCQYMNHRVYDAMLEDFQ